MGKEAKLGVAFILFLLVTFCAVLAWRLRGSSDEGSEAAATAEEASPAAENPDDADRPDQTVHSVAKPANATLVEASSGEGPADSPLPVGEWNVATDEGAADGAASADVENPPALSYMPMPPAPESAKVQGPPGEQDPQVADPAPTWQNAPPGAPDPVADRGAPPQGTDRGYPVLPPADSARQDTGGLRLIEPPPAREDYAPADRPLPAMPVGKSGGFGPPPAAEPARTEDGKYTVQPNDSFWVISQRLYGSGAYFKALAEHNRDRFEAGDRLAVGDVISAPSREDIEEIYPGLCPKPAHREVLENRLSNVSSQRPYGGRTYLVQEGDTLFDIARYELGKASRWVEIYELNRPLIGSDHDYLPPGVELVLPNDAPADRMTQQPDAGSIYRR